MISVDSLHKVILPEQLTQEFDGTLPYDNDEWIDIRMVCICSMKKKSKIRKTIEYYESKYSGLSE